MAAWLPPKIVAPDVGPAQLSFRRVFDVLEASCGLREAIAELFPSVFERGLSGDLVLVSDASDLVDCEVIDGPANGANEISVLVKPSERYLELVAAVGRHLNAVLVFDPHGWPSIAAPDGASLAHSGERSSPTGGAA